MLRATLLHLSESKRLSGWVTTAGAMRRMARRFVAGESLDDAVAAARQAGHPWSAVAALLGGTRQAAQQRFGLAAGHR